MNEDARSLVISQGEPSGIGPEIAVKAWAALGGRIKGRNIRLIGNAEIFLKAAAFSGIAAKNLHKAIDDTGGNIIAVPGHPSLENAPSVIGAITAAVNACRSGRAAALVTAPIQKATLTASGFRFPGHTEYLAHLTGAKRAVMMLASTEVEPPLRVVPFTIHIPLAKVIGELDTHAIAAAGEIVLAALAADFGCRTPVLAIAGLNPHAGEDGTIGHEEAEIIAPAAVKLRERGHKILGPLSADTLFHEAARKTYDAALCMYHDQALIPIKTLAFWTGVNVTLGLPIVRTSPDHGTALDLTGRGLANEKSMIAAITMAADIAEKRGL